MAQATKTTKPVEAPNVRRRREAARPSSRLVLSSVSLVASIALAATFWWSLWFFHHSLHLVGHQELGARLVIVVLVAVGFALPVSGVLAMARSLKSRRLAQEGRYLDARVAAEDARDWAWYVLGFGLSALAVSFIALLLSANHGSVRHVFFNWKYIKLDQIVRAFWLNIKVFMVAEVFVLIWGLVVAVARLMPGKAGAPVRVLAVAYTDLFRGMPAVMVIYLIVFGLGLAQLPVLTDLSREQQRFWYPVLSLTLVYGAYVAEVYRSGLDSIHWSQTAGARSLGLSYPQTLRYVVVPQAVRRIIPPLLNDFIGLQKDTALLSFVGVVEVFNRSQLLKSKYLNLTPVVGAGLCFVVITIPMARFTDYLIKRDQARMRAGGT
jgi:polar amino acid transport system permease protein